jgi:hypothetical protein
MIWQGQELSEEDINDLYAVHFLGTASGPVVLAHLLHYICHLWDEIEPDAELVARQNIGKQLLKRIGMIREDQIFELTRRLIEAPAAAPLREKTS